MVSNAYNLTAFPPLPPLVGTYHQHIMKCVDLRFHKCWLQWIQLLPVGFWQNPLLGIHLQHYIFVWAFFYVRKQVSLFPQAKCKTENSCVYIIFKDKWHKKGNVFVLEAWDRGKKKKGLWWLTHPESPLPILRKIHFLKPKCSLYVLNMFWNMLAIDWHGRRGW